ncbi:MAG: hypothetical protein GF308_13500 [Candidatus Heimdallarchaeota archaeon]|nr:hypothetical protein [Candidatus Heimdallarchaeota archaeon]
MPTTIQIKEETKNALFMEKNRLERERGRKVTYDEVIRELLKEKEEETRIKPERTLEELQGTLNKEAKKIYQELREEYRKNEQ